MQCSYYACMPAMTIRDVPDNTRDVLASRAARNGQSLQEYLRTLLIGLASQADVDELVHGVRDRKASSTANLAPDEILDHLASGRR